MSDHPAEEGHPTVSPTSRRGFLVATGATASVGIPTASADADEGEGANTDFTVDGSPAQRRVVRCVADHVWRSRSDAVVASDASGTTPAFERFVTGDVDAVVASRPIAPAEAATAAANGIAYSSRELPTGTAALRYQREDWFDCLSADQIDERWRRHDDVATWAEMGASDRPETITSRQTPETSSLGTIRGDADAGPSQSNPEPPVFVRGIREFQYESGFGGVGHYAPDRERLARGSTVVDGASAPLVRLRYLYIDKASVERPVVKAFARTYADAISIPVSYFADPHRS